MTSYSQETTEVIDIYNNNNKKTSHDLDPKLIIAKIKIRTQACPLEVVVREDSNIQEMVDKICEIGQFEVNIK